MVNPPKLFLIIFALSLLNISLTFSQELPLPGLFSYGGNGRQVGSEYEVFNSNENLLAVFLSARLRNNSIPGYPQTANFRNSSGRHATVVRLYEEYGLWQSNRKPFLMSVPVGAVAAPFQARGNYQFYYCFCYVNPEVADVKYVLPVSEGKMVKVEKGTIEYPQGYEDRLTVFIGTIFKLQAGDTIRAARGGIIESIVVNNGNVLERFNRLTVRHADKTASDYVGFEASSITVQEGDDIFTGMPLARAGGSSLANSADLFFSASYIKVDLEKKFENWSSIVFMDPSFETKTHKGALVSNQSYIGYINTELIIQEMSRKVKKQFRRGSRGGGN